MLHKIPCATLTNVHIKIYTHPGVPLIQPRRKSKARRFPGQAADEERSWHCCLRRLKTGSTGEAAARAPGGRGTAKRETGGRPRCVRGSTGVKRLVVLGVSGASGKE